MRELKLGKTGVFWFVSRFFVKFSSSTWKPLASSTVNPLALFNLCMVAIRSLNASSIDLVGVNSISSEASREMSKLPTLFSIKPVLKKSLCVFWRKKKKAEESFFFITPIKILNQWIRIVRKVCAVSKSCQITVQTI